MILSVSRRTDIPNYYSDWFLNRIREGFLYVRNPMNPHQVSRIELSPEVVDCIVFWTKNPEPMLERLGELEPYSYYFQFTLTGYGQDIEPGVPDKRENVISTFQRLSKTVGPCRVIWRYDPILFTPVYTPEYHLRAFSCIAESLKGYTNRCVISFVDRYAKNNKSLKQLEAYELQQQELEAFARRLSVIAAENEMTVASCAEMMDLAHCGIEHSSCIDRKLIEDIIGCPLKVGKDKNQRPECGCVESVEVGTYDTCKNGCLYCYANSSPRQVERTSQDYAPDSPLLCGRTAAGDKVTERKVTSLRDGQLNLFL